MATRPRLEIHTNMPDDRETLKRRLERAHARRDREPPFSPDWDAAMDEIDELIERLARIEGELATA